MLKLASIVIVGASLVGFMGTFASINQMGVEEPPKIEELFDALWQVESSRREGVIWGDGGASLGPLQISRAYWQDATEFDSSIGGKYEDVVRLDYSKQVVDAYWRRWAPAAYKGQDFEVLARIHNGGPRGATKQATVGYWSRVSEVMRGR
jgi:hypothetical protein